MSAMFFGGTKFREQFLKRVPKEQSCDFNSNSDKRFQRRILKIFSKVHTVKKPPSMAAMFFDGSKFRKQFLYKGYPKKIPVKLFQNRTWGFREDFLRISSCPHSAKSLSPPPPMVATFFDGSKFHEQFQRGSPKEQSCEMI